MKHVTCWLLLCAFATTARARAQNAPATPAIHGTVWHYSLSGYEVDMTFQSDSVLHWQDKNRGETNQSKTLRISDHARLTGWYESDKTFVSLYSDFATGQAYCHVFRPDGKIIPMKGTVVPKK